MSAHTLKRWLCRLAMRIAPANMREWAEAMVREIDEIEDPRAALEWAAACFTSCAAQRLRAILRIVAIAARLALGGYCLFVCGEIAVQTVRALSARQMEPGAIGAWLLIAILFGATAPLVALRRRWAAWPLFAATAVMAANIAVRVRSAPPDVAARELAAATVMIAAMLAFTAAAYWLTRPPRNDLVV